MPLKTTRDMYNLRDSGSVTCTVDLYWHVKTLPPPPLTRLLMLRAPSSRKGGMEQATHGPTSREAPFAHVVRDEASAQTRCTCVESTHCERELIPVVQKVPSSWRSFAGFGSDSRVTKNARRGLVNLHVTSL